MEELHGTHLASIRSPVYLVAEAYPGGIRNLEPMVLTRHARSFC